MGSQGVFGYQAASPEDIANNLQTRFSTGSGFNFATVGPKPLAIPDDPSQNDINFAAIYSAFFPNQPPTGFETYLNNFIQANGGGSFNASNEVGNFLTQVQQSYSLSLSGTTQSTSSVGATSADTDIIGTIFALLVDLIGTLQGVAASQANNLQVLTNWQAAYTTLETNIHTFTQNDGTTVGGSNAQDARSDLNSANQTYTENVRSRRSIVQDSANSLQSNLNQSNDTANQEANLCTQLLQELSTILGSIYH